jgi:phosphoserine phosphatase RsbU/P
MGEYEHFDLELEPGDCVVTLLDALIESSDADGEQLGENGVLRLLPENLSSDDVTVLLLRANGGAQSLTLMDKMRAMGRMAGAALRSLVPGRRALSS